MILYVDLCDSESRDDSESRGDSQCRANRLKKMILKKMPDFCESLSGLEELEKRLRASVHDIDIIIIHACSDSPISELLKYKNDLKDLSIVLVLNGITSDRQIEQLLKLYPRYMTFDQKYETILAVLEKRIRYNQLTKKQKVLSGANKKRGGSDDRSSPPAGPENDTLKRYAEASPCKRTRSYG